jgi:type VI secretion system secreted protein VgrG
VGNYTQANRSIRVDTPLPVDTLLLEGFEAEEGVSRPYLYSLDLLSEDAELDPADLLRQPVLVTVEAEEGRPPVLTHGIVRSFVQLDMSRELTRYHAEVVPALWFLTQTRDCRIFQEKTVLEIVAEVLDEPTSVGAIAYDIRCARSYPLRTYCVQYRESDFNFISRLLEDEGIFYWFEHDEDDHTLVLADSHTSFEECPGYGQVRMDSLGAPDEEVVRSLVQEHAVGSYEVTLADYDPLQSSLRLNGTASSAGDPRDPVFDYPGHFTELEVGEYRAQIDLERREKGRRRATGTSTCRGLRAGFIIGIDGHYRPDANARYYLDRVRHRAEAGSFRADGRTDFDYTNEFVALPDDVPYRPDLAARRPRIHGTQTAVVVGKQGEEVWVDEHGRVKVQFHWDKYGQNDENSSCWVRVSTQTAGKNWGHVEIPRIGHEVLVDFLEGDPDRPVIVGSLYNDEMTTPFPLPDNGVKSGIKTYSSKGGGGFNEISLDDSKGSELINVHAQKDLTEAVLNDRTRSVGHDEAVTVANDQTVTVKEGNAELLVDAANRRVIVAEQYYRLAKTVYEEAQEKIESKVGDQLTTTDTGKIEMRATADSTHTLTSSKIESKVGSKSSTSVEDGTVTLKVGGATVTVTANSIELAFGSSSVTVDGSGVSISGTSVSVDGASEVALTGGQVKLNS